MALGVEAEHIAQKMPKQLFIDFFNIHIGAIYNVYIYIFKQRQCTYNRFTKIRIKIFTKTTFIFITNTLMSIMKAFDKNLYQKGSGI